MRSLRSRVGIFAVTNSTLRWRSVSEHRSSVRDTTISLGPRLCDFVVVVVIVIFFVFVAILEVDIFVFIIV